MRVFMNVLLLKNRCREVSLDNRIPFFLLEVKSHFGQFFSAAFVQFVQEDTTTGRAGGFGASLSTVRFVNAKNATASKLLAVAHLVVAERF
ncbi:MAG: hypothetical protein IJY20_04470 [Clostridia bacterium]|nr:hypothetical protein [Clostridia bacterium]